MADYIKAKTYEEWLELRTKGLGGSDIGTALGFNSFKSPYQLWAEKTGLIEPEDISDKVAIQIGRESYWHVSSNIKNTLTHAGNTN